MNEIEHPISDLLLRRSLRNRFSRPDAFLLELGNPEPTAADSDSDSHKRSGTAVESPIPLFEGGLVLDPRDSGHWARMLPRLAQEWAASAAFRTLPTLPERLQHLAGRPVSKFAPSKSAYALPFTPPGGASPSHAAAAAADVKSGSKPNGSSDVVSANPLHGSFDGCVNDNSDSKMLAKCGSATRSRGPALLARSASAGIGKTAGFFSRKGTSSSNSSSVSSSKNVLKKRVPSEIEASLLARFQDLAATPVQATTHGLLLEDLWLLISEHFCQDASAAESAKQQLDSQGSSLGWILVGFQGQSPIHDFKSQGAGLLGLKQLTFFLRRRRHAAQAVLDPLSPCFQMQAATLEKERNRNVKEGNVMSVASRRASSKALRASISRRASGRASIVTSQNNPMRNRPSMLKSQTSPNLAAAASNTNKSLASSPAIATAASVGVTLSALPPFGLAACAAAKIVAQAFGLVNERTGSLRDFKTTKRAYWHLAADLNDVFCAAILLVHKVRTRHPVQLLKLTSTLFSF